jgi:hypothetical protein
VRLLRRAARLVLACGCLAIAGTAAAHTPPTFRPAVAGRWAGQVKGSNAFVAIVVDGRETAGHHNVLAYVCNGATGRGAATPTIVEWFHGTTSASSFSLRSKDGYRLALTVTHGKATGTLTYPGKGGASRSFAAAAAKGRAGLYRGQKKAGGKTYLAGLIVLNDGRGHGAVGINGVIAQAVEWNGVQSGHPTATISSSPQIITILPSLLLPAVQSCRGCTG